MVRAYIRLPVPYCTHQLFLLFCCLYTVRCRLESLPRRAGYVFNLHLRCYQSTSPNRFYGKVIKFDDLPIPSQCARCIHPSHLKICTPTASQPFDSNKPQNDGDKERKKPDALRTSLQRHLAPLLFGARRCKTARRGCDANVPSG